MSSSLITPEFAQARLAEHIAHGKAHSLSVVNELDRQARERVTFKLSRTMMTFDVTTDALNVSFDRQAFEKDESLKARVPERVTFNPHALSQFLANIHIRKDWLEQNQIDGKRDRQALAAASKYINEAKMWRIGSRDALNGATIKMLRLLKNDVVAWLGAGYGVFDFDMIFPAFVDVLKQTSNNDVVFTGGELSIHRYALSVMKPRIYPVQDGDAIDYVVVGGEIHSTDVGGTRLNLLRHISRVVCWNGMVGHSYFKRTHKASAEVDYDEEAMEITEETRADIARSTISLMRDAVRTAFSEKAVQQTLEEYKRSLTARVDVLSETEKLYTDGTVSIEQRDELRRLMTMRAEEILPNTQNPDSRARFANAVAFLANNTPDGENAIALREQAGKYIFSNN